MNITTLYHEPRVYAYTLPEVPKLAGWIKVGYTDKQTVAERIAQQLKTPLLNYHTEMDEPAVTNDGWIDLDRQRNRLVDSLHKIEERCVMCVDGRRNNCRVLGWKKKMQDEIDYLENLIVKNGGRTSRWTTSSASSFVASCSTANEAVV